MLEFSFSLRLSYTPLYGCTFVYPFVDGHLGGFHLLDIVNHAAVNVGIYISVQNPYPIPFGYIYLGVE